MSLLPFLLELENPLLYRDSLIPAHLLPFPTRGLGGGPGLLRQTETSIRTPSGKFQVNLDVQHFSPDEIAVKIVDGYLVVEGKHEEKQDHHGYVSRQFTRRYLIPEGCSVDGIQSQLSSDGVLTIKAPLQENKANERLVPIQQTGPVRTQHHRQEFEAKEEVGNGEPQKSNLENGN